MHPIIFLWVHPRSMSTAVERIMRERGDLHCLHEPFLHYYYLQCSSKPLPHFATDDNHPQSYEATREMILELASKAPVFAKDMAYYVLPRILEDESFCRRITHCFLIRNPIRSILSYYRLDPSLSAQEIGIQAQWQLHKQLTHWKLDPVVMQAETIQADPKQIIGEWWRQTGLDYQEDAFSWNTETTPQDWQYVQGWHKQVSQSTGIQQVTTEQNQQAQRDFETLIQQAPHLQDYLEQNLPAYRALQNLALKLKSPDQTL